MNLLQVRRKFRELSGRADLVDDTGADTGADFFINEGRKYLDRKDETQKSWASCFKIINTGQFSVSFPYCRAIKEIWIATVTERWQLEKKRLQDLIAGYLTGLPSSRSNGAPEFYSPCVSRYVPEDSSVITLAAFIGFVDTPAGNAHEYNSILLSTPVDQQMMIEIKGLFYSAELVADTDVNYWSEVHPMLLIQAAIRETEAANRNTQGIKDWNEVISTTMQQLGMDLVEEMIAEADQMED